MKNWNGMKRMWNWYEKGKRKEEKRRRGSKHRPTYKMGSGITHSENKYNKAPGEDKIVAELIKHGGEALVNAMYKLIRTIWETENTQEMWKVGKRR